MRRLVGFAGGFTLIEMICAMALLMCLMAAALPCWLTLQKVGVGQTDRATALIQSRVAGARFEADLRQCGSLGVAYSVEGPILSALPSEVDFLLPGDTETPSKIVEWEIAGGKLMRRWGPSTATRPDAMTHSLFVDNKSMLEGLGETGGFMYRLTDGRTVNIVTGSELSRVEAIVLTAQVADARSHVSSTMRSEARVAQ